MPSRADPLVLLPGLNCSAALWCLLDLGPALTPRLTEPTLDAQVDRLLDELPARFALAGLSLGGIVAMALVRRAPERVSRLALMSTNPNPPSPAQRAEWAGQRATLAAGATARELQQALLPVLLSPSVLIDRLDLVELTLGMADDVGSTELDAQLALQGTRVDERPGLTQVRCPTVIVAAADDLVCGVDRHREMQALVPGAALVVLERCAHLSPLERPDEVSKILNRWRSGFS